MHTKTMGFKSSIAYNGKEAIQRIIEKITNKCSVTCVIYKAIFMDINMPIMNGWDAVREIRKI